MIIPDVNLLLYAEVEGFAEHDRARLWWEDALNGGATIGLTEPTVHGFHQGNLTTDAQLAAYAIERGAELHSHDTDFGRFPGLHWIDPLSD